MLFYIVPRIHAVFAGSALPRPCVVRALSNAPRTFWPQNPPSDVVQKSFFLLITSQGNLIFFFDILRPSLSPLSLS